MSKILVVDDTPMDRILVEGILSRNGLYEVESVENGAIAWSRLSSAADDYVAVVTDLNMPEMNGLELVRAARVGMPSLPVLLITANGSEELAVEALACGAASYVPKKALATQLLDVIEHVLCMSIDCDYQSELSKRMSGVVMRFELESNAELFPALIEMAHQMVASVSHIGVQDAIRLMTAWESALFIALAQTWGIDVSEVQSVRYATPELELPSGILFVEIETSRQQVIFRVRHEGEVIGTEVLTNLAPGDLLDLSKRNFVLLKSFTDEVRYDTVSKTLELIWNRKV